MDWIRFFRAHGIDYDTTGPKTTRGWVEIHCPFCGHNDPSKHMGVRLRSGRWSCWRNPQSHSGSDPARLIQQLIGCSYSEARRLVVDAPTTSVRDYEVADRLFSQVLDSRDTPRRSSVLTLEAEGLLPLTGKGPTASQCLQYLRNRTGSYTGAALEWLVNTYELHYATKGPFAKRVVFPIRDRDNRLLTWVGRSIRKDDELRYLAQPVAERERFKQVALVPTKDTLLGLPYLWRCVDPRVLVVCEGPFDATRLTCYGRSFGVHATCLFGLSMSYPQLMLLSELRRRFRVMVILLDEGNEIKAFRMANSGMDFHRYSLQGSKDPGDFSPQEAIEVCVDLLRLTGAG